MYIFNVELQRQTKFYQILLSQREINSLEKSVQKMKVEGNIELNIERHVDSTEKEMSQSPSL